MHDKVVGMTTYEYDKWIEAWRLLKLFFTLIVDYVIVRNNVISDELGRYNKIIRVLYILDLN